MNSSCITSSFILTLVCVCLSHACLDFMIGIWPMYKTLASLNLAVAGFIGCVGALAGEGLQILFGSLSDRGYRKSVMLGGLLASTAMLGLAWTDHYGAIFFLYLITCVGSGAFHPSAASLVSDLPSTRKGLLVGVYTSGGALGMASSQCIFMQAYTWLDGNVVWLALPPAILAVYVFLSRIDSASSSNKSSLPRFNIKTLFNFFHSKDLRMLYFSQVCAATLLWGTMFLLPDLLKTREYAPWITFGGGHLVFILGSALTMIPAGYLADRYSSRTVILIAMSSCMILFYSLLNLPLLDEMAVLALLFFIGASLGVINPVAIALGTRLAPQQKGLVSAFLMGLVWCISEGLGQGGGGYLATCFSEDAPAKALAILGVLFLVGLWTTFQLPKKEQETESVLLDT